MTTAADLNSGAGAVGAASPLVTGVAAVVFFGWAMGTQMEVASIRSSASSGLGGLGNAAAGSGDSAGVFVGRIPGPA